MKSGEHSNRAVRKNGPVFLVGGGQWDSWEENWREAVGTCGVGSSASSAVFIPHSVSCDMRLRLCGLEGPRLLGPLNPIGDFLQIGFLPGSDDFEPFLGISVRAD